MVSRHSVDKALFWNQHCARRRIETGLEDTNNNNDIIVITRRTQSRRQECAICGRCDSVLGTFESSLALQLESRILSSLVPHLVVGVANVDANLATTGHSAQTILLQGKVVGIDSKISGPTQSHSHLALAAIPGKTRHGQDNPQAVGPLCPIDGHRSRTVTTDTIIHAHARTHKDETQT